MRNSVHGSIMKHYEKIRLVQIKEREERQNEVYTKNPAIEELDMTLAKLGIHYNRLIMKDPMNAAQLIERLKTEATILGGERAALMQKAGFPINHTEIFYHCELCKDTGYVGSIENPSKCSCYRKLFLNALSEKYGAMLPENIDFDDFNIDFYSKESKEENYGIKISPYENIQLILNKCEDFVEGFSEVDGKNLLFDGPTGTGKTFIANIIAKKLINQGHVCVYQSAPRLFELIHASKWKNSNLDEVEEDPAEILFDADLLIIDDLGTEPQSASRYAGLLELLERRATENRKRPCRIIISTNLGLRSLREFYDERVVSRIIGSFDFLKFAGDDIRRQKKLQKLN